MRPEDVAREMFETYNAAGANPGKTFDGRPVPSWPELSDDVRAKWIAAASNTYVAIRLLRALHGNALALEREIRHALEAIGRDPKNLTGGREVVEEAER